MRTIDVAPTDEPSGGTSIQAAVDAASPGDVVRLLPGRHWTRAPVLLDNRRDLKICGLPGTMIDGGHGPDPFDLPNPNDQLYRLANPRLAVATDWSFFRLLGCDGITFENLALSYCWPIAIFCRDSRDIALRGSRITGSTFVLLARDFDLTHDRSERFIIEGNAWQQDDSPDHDLWRRVDWGQAHGNEGSDGCKRYFTGALFAGADIIGNVRFRDNRVSDAYNGIVMWGSRQRQQGLIGQRRNRNVFVHDNIFERIRDNPVEPEHFAQNWHVRHNKLVNCHAWFSFDGVAGSDWYLYGNVGWFTERQGHPAQKSRGGKVLKFYEGDALPSRGFYVIHNSWFLRCPVIAGGDDADAHITAFRFLNNAVEFARPSEFPPGTVEAGDLAMVQNFDWSFGSNVLDGTWTNDSAYFPKAKAFGQEAHGLTGVTSPGFANAKAGDFTLAAHSSLRGRGVALPLDLPSGPVTVPGPRDVGAFQGTTLTDLPVLRALERFS